MAGLEGTVKTPFGEMKKKTAAIGGVGIGGLALIVWYRHKQAANASAASSASTGASTSDQNIDPATGFPYGSAEDIAALTQQQGLQYGQYPTGGYNPNPQPPGPGSFVTNAEWAQYVEQWLTQNEGADPITVGNAIGKYISAQPLTPDMVSVVTNAIAIGGDPPVAGPDGNPPGYKTQSGPGPGPGGTKAENPVTGLKVDADYTGIDVSWNASKNATSYSVRCPGASNSPQRTTGTSARMRNLRRGHKYTVTVVAHPADPKAKFASQTVTMK